MHARLGIRLILHDRQVRVDLRSAGTCACDLITIKIYHADVVWSHEALRDECRCAKHEVVTDADSDVTTVTIDITFIPDALTDAADAPFECLHLWRVEKCFELCSCLWVSAGSPIKYCIWQHWAVDTWAIASGCSGWSTRGSRRYLMLANNVASHRRELCIGRNGRQALALCDHCFEIFRCV